MFLFVQYNFVDMNERLHRLERLDEVTRNLSTSLEVEPFLQSLVEAACELTSSESASILRYDMLTDHLEYAVTPFFLRDKLLGATLPLEGSVAGWAFRHAQPLQIADAPNDARHFREIDSLTGVTTRSILAVPLIFRGGPIGVIEALNKNGNTHYTEDDVACLESLASLAAFALRERDLQQRTENSSNDIASLDRLKSDFIAITSHELRTPLGLILGHATFLRELAGNELHEQLDVIIRHAKRLKEIVESISNVNNYDLGAARIRRSLVSMAGVVREAVDSFQADAQAKNIRLRAEISGADPLNVEGEASKIALALSNLIQNALTFTNPGGYVFVSANAVPGFVKISVVDDGIGIPLQELPRVFDRFFQVESHLTRKHGGMGLGLSVAKGMIELHGGRIWVESVEGQGTNFSFLLPVDAQQASAAGRVFY